MGDRDLGGSEGMRLLDRRDDGDDLAIRVRADAMQWEWDDEYDDSYDDLNEGGFGPDATTEDDAAIVRLVAPFCPSPPTTTTRLR